MLQFGLSQKQILDTIIRLNSTRPQAIFDELAGGNFPSIFYLYRYDQKYE